MSDKPKLTNPFEDDYILGACWRDGMLWAVQDPNMLAQYRLDTGNKYEAPTTVVDKMVDNACGRDFQFAKQFADWWTDNYFGRPENVYGKEQ